MSNNPQSAELKDNALDPKDFDYFSRRDVDGDGKADVVHAVKEDGTTYQYHLDAKGEVILTEADEDGDSRYEVSYHELNESDVEAKIDTDGDGEVDVVRFFDKSTEKTFQEDSIEDGKVIHSQVDLDGDGVNDFELLDTNRDGEFDTVAIDSDKDSIPNALYRDNDGDGSFDEGLVDVDNSDGILETRFDASDYSDGSLGNLDSYTDLIKYNAGEQYDAGGDSF